MERTQAVTLRRMKSDQYNGQPLVVLPPKVITLSEVQFSEEEEAIYRAFEEKSQLDFKEYVRKGFGANYSHILVRPAPLHSLGSPANLYSHDNNIRM